MSRHKLAEGAVVAACALGLNAALASLLGAWFLR